MSGCWPISIGFGGTNQPSGFAVRVCVGGGVWHKPSVSICLPLAVPIGLLPLLILTLCGSERVVVVSTEPPDDLSCLTTPGLGRPGDGAVAHAVDQGHPDAPSESECVCGGGGLVGDVRAQRVGFGHWGRGGLGWCALLHCDGCPQPSPSSNSPEQTCKRSHNRHPMH